jgi:GMP synthase PP-ATPase subunit
MRQFDSGCRRFLFSKRLLVMGAGRTCDYAVAQVDLWSKHSMTTQWEHLLFHNLLRRVSSRIIREGVV